MNPLRAPEVFKIRNYAPSQRPTFSTLSGAHRQSRELLLVGAGRPTTFPPYRCRSACGLEHSAANTQTAIVVIAELPLFGRLLGKAAVRTSGGAENLERLLVVETGQNGGLRPGCFRVLRWREQPFVQCKLIADFTPEFGCQRDRVRNGTSCPSPSALQLRSSMKRLRCLSDLPGAFTPVSVAPRME